MSASQRASGPGASDSRAGNGHLTRVTVTLLRFILPRAGSREDAGEAVVPFMARVLVNQIVALPHGQRHGPGARPDCRVVNRVLVEERVGVEATESLGQ